MTPDDMTLVREFVARQSEPAFTTLVERHIGLVHSAALRQTGDAHLAEEITQAVFIILARKAASLGTNTILPAWLYRTARYAASNALKIQRRRQMREQEAYMQSTLQTNESPEAWPQLAPLLDATMAELSESDRASLVLRYFENRPWHEIATRMQMTEDAAQKRAARALEKLRLLFVKRGVKLTAALIASAVSANSVQAAPASMAKTISVVVLTKGAAVSTTTLTISQGALKIMAWTKVKTAVAIGLAAILVTGTTAVVVIKHPAQKTPALNSYITPEASFESAMLAMGRGDPKTVAKNYTPEFMEQFLATAGKGKSDQELATLFQQIASQIGDYQIDRREDKSEAETILHISASRMGAASVPLKKIGNEWKISGNLMTEKPAQ